MEEIKTDNNCIIKAFENNPISIIHEENDGKKNFYFKSSDIGKALELKNIAVSIQCYDDDEKVLRKAYTLGGNQDTTFLISQGRQAACSPL
jgi:prophage antirepressor-like protein